jgi:hypothetical protein
MAHFAKLDDNNVVLEVNVVSNETLDNLPYPQSEPKGIVFLSQWSAGHTNWKQTSYNRNFRKNFAGIGFTYDANYDAFIPPKPDVECTLNTETFMWDLVPVSAQPNLSASSGSINSTGVQL